MLLPNHYDDGGISGGTMDRPGLQQLLADVRAPFPQVWELQREQFGF